MVAKKKVVKEKKEFADYGVITSNGRLVAKDVLEKYEVGVQSKQIDDVVWTPNVLEPPHNLALLMSWLEISVYHNSCVRVKQQDSVGIGYELTYDTDLLAEGEEVPKTESDTNYKTLMNFFGLVNGKENIVSLLKKVFLDFEGNGNGYIELGTDVKGLVAGIWHINSTTIRWMKDKQRLVQKVGENYCYFKVFGDDRILNKKSGVFVKSLTHPEDEANSIIALNQYTWKSVMYGLPEWLPALYAMFGDQKEREYNLDFFINFGIPAYAVLIEGGTMLKEDKEAIVKYFETELKGSNHKTLTLNSPKGTTIKFEKLNVTSQEASFRMYRKDNRDEILTAHHVPPYRVGIIESGALGGSVAEDTDRIYLDSVINPRQEQFEWVINELIIKKGFGINGWVFSFEDININDQKKNTEIWEKQFKMGAMSANEIRKENGRDPYAGGDILYVPTGMTPIGVSQEGIDLDRSTIMEDISEEERKAGEEEGKAMKEAEAEEVNN